jgi:AraC-like DNA-binding protein
MMTRAWSDVPIGGGTSASQALAEPVRATPVVHREFTAVVVRLLDDTRLALATNPEIAKARIAHVSAMLLAEEDRRAPGAGSKAATVVRGGLAPWQIRRVTERIEANLRATIRVRDFGEITGLSTSHFARAFKASFGETVHGYIIRRRMERAQELMLTTSDSLCQIALECGLCDQAHFSRLFRRMFGVTPGVWRRHWPAGSPQA